jgi:hypothetical protein
MSEMKGEHLGDITNETATHNKNIITYRETRVNFRKVYQPRTNLVWDEKGDLRVDSHILNRREEKKHLYEYLLLNVTCRI